MSMEVRAAIAAERRDLADILAGLRPPQWDAPTLCDGWRVREVVAHQTMPFRYSAPKVLAGLIKAGGNFNKLADRAARRDAASMSSGELLAAMTNNVNHPWRPPGGGFEGALSHDVIHGLDITVGLGLDRRVPLDRLRIVLPKDAKAKGVKYFGVDLTAVRFQADDLDWSIGSGEPVQGNGQDLLLALCGRRLPPGRLRGTACRRFTAKV